MCCDRVLGVGAYRLAIRGHVFGTNIAQDVVLFLGLKPGL